MFKTKPPLPPAEGTTCPVNLELPCEVMLDLAIAFGFSAESKFTSSRFISKVAPVVPLLRISAAFLFPLKFEFCEFGFW